MLRGTHDYGSTGPIAHFFEELHEHEHLPTRDDTPLQTILRDHDITALNIAKRMIQGSAIALGMGFWGYLHKVADRNIVADRAMFQPSYYLRRFRFHIAYGALGGFAWWLLYDNLLCPHGYATFDRHITAYAIGGSVVAMTLWNPGSFLHGAILGALVGLGVDMKFRKRYPPGFELELPNFDPEQRERARKDEVQAELSRKLRQSRPSLRSNLFAL